MSPERARYVGNGIVCLYDGGQVHAGLERVFW